MRLVELIKDTGARTLTPTLLVSLLQAPAELDRIYTPLFSRSLGREAGWPQRVGGIFGMDAVRTLQRFAPDNAGYLARCKRVCVISDWIEGVPVEEIERVYTTNIFAAPFNYGDIRNIVDTTRFHLRSARQIVSLLLTGTPEFEQDIDNLLQQLEAGLPADTLDLLTLPIALHRGDYLALRSAGVTTRDQLWERTRQQLDDLLGSVIYSRLDILRPQQSQKVDADVGSTV
jgi:ATP-dependent DNA helicase